MDKRSLSERDICTKFITLALRQAGWDEMVQIREEVGFTKGRIIVRGKLVTRGRAKRADYILYYRPNLPVALIEAKDNTHSVGDGMQQALDYAATLNIPFVFSSNGDGFVFHDRTGASDPRETQLPLDAFPSPADLWARFRAWRGLDAEAEAVVLQDHYDDGSGKTPRYYQVNAINAAIGTNLLFFEKGAPTQDIWFWEHQVPEGHKAYSMTRPIRLAHLDDCAAWWGGPRREGRQEGERAWKVTASEIKARGYNLDFKNPHTVAENHGDPETLLKEVTSAEAEVAMIRDELKAILAEALLR